MGNELLPITVSGGFMFTDIKFEDVKNITAEEYFEGYQYSVDMFNKKYAF